ncbi:phosphoenolpyruvate--protein phosphotransferase [Mycoplasmopsis agassizii]|uniref:Phosphoenolpyruvate-protein phosphotransferase n=1 Tax=Mycoplasmopsis agassizii TaxID=33922 RepID=A0ABX4H4Y8_9BACT|nr:phosphoenolpyruvate--protein phosphotransferase [Mycoplasmopsis agassizii]PAF54960.1 phosphoenolpyruvate--protein phosphotransferase [Mycoplasmopsis agassizii]SMC16970.1 phosphoenolpyruvate--protein phosphotransferase [Mycoplasmopsis agassizii]
MKYQGIGASAGVVVAKIFRLEEVKITIRDDFKSAEAELQELDRAFTFVANDLENLITKLKKAENLEEAEIFLAHLEILKDPDTKALIENEIKANQLNAMQALDKTYNNYITMFESMDDAYMRERAADLKDLRYKLLASLANVKIFDLSQISEDSILVAFDLTPSQTASLNLKHTLGFATNIGGRTSHSAIMARSLNIPAVVGLKDILENTKDGDTLALNGQSGEVIVNPNKEELERFAKDRAAYLEYLNTILEYKGKASTTKDNFVVELAANIGSPKDMEGVINNDAEAVGLFRSEFLYMDANNWPTEEFQFQKYAEAIKKFNDPKRKMIIRTLDIGGDKTLNYFKFPEELNPFLGYRAIRLTLEKKEVFKDQLRALIRAAQFGKLGIMFPMITNLPEFIEAKKFYEETYEELVKEKVTIGKKEDIEIGLMIETPAAAILADKFAKYADFLSIGTNDLIQYSMAADRMNEHVSYLYQPLNPSILKFIKLTIDGGHKHGKWVGMCGEMAGDQNAIPLLLGLGLDEFSMSASSILPARKLLSTLEKTKWEKIATQALELENEEQVKQLLEKELR